MHPLFHRHVVSFCSFLSSWHTLLSRVLVFGVVDMHCYLQLGVCIFLSGFPFRKKCSKFISDPFISRKAIFLVLFTFPPFIVCQRIISERNFEIKDRTSGTFSPASVFCHISTYNVIYPVMTCTWQLLFSFHCFSDTLSTKKVNFAHRTKTCHLWYFALHDECIICLVMPINCRELETRQICIYFFLWNWGQFIE